MAVYPLENSRWSFASHCFVCEPSNERGLRVPFFHDDEAECVFAISSLDQHYSGAPTYLHGGVTLALVDEAMSWATIALAGKFAFTQELSATFEWPVRVGREYRIEARVADHDDKRIVTEAAVLDTRGRRCLAARAEMAVISVEQARDAVAPEMTDLEQRFLR